MLSSLIPKKCVAVHHSPGSFSDRWLEHCSLNRIPHIVVDCYASDIMTQLASARMLLWHWSHGIPKNHLMARSLIMAAEATGLKVFPSYSTCWHYDDKLAQKYLLEAVGAPLVPTHIFYDRDEALGWIERASFPVVFKLRKGAGSENVGLVRSSHEAARLVNRAFGPGFNPGSRYLSDFGVKLARARQRRDLLGVLRRLPRSVRVALSARQGFQAERGYVLFQDFIAHNEFDTRITVIGNRAFAFTRDVRHGDFRASGSGSIKYAAERIDQRCVEVAFATTRRIGAQSLAFDFVRGPASEPLLVEISYCYQAEAVYNCPGHWDETLAWREGHVWPQDAILEDMLDAVE